MTELVAIWLCLTVLVSALTGFLLRWIYPNWPELRIAVFAATALPILMIGIDVSLLIRDWNVDVGRRERVTIGFDIGRFLIWFSIVTFMLGIPFAKGCLRWLRRQ